MVQALATAYGVKKLTQGQQESKPFWRFDNVTMWIYIVIFVIILFPLIRYIKKELQKTKDQALDLQQLHNWTENQNPSVQQSKADKITTRKDIQAAAKSLAHDLGTKYSDNNHWYDIFNPQGWTENDKKVADTLIYQRNNYGLLKKLYYICYSNSRNLSDDILKYLDKDQLTRVSKYLNI